MGDFLLRTDVAYDWYKAWNDANLILSFKGDFNQEMVRSLTQLTKGKDVVKGIKKKAQIRLMGVLIECMQNISIHGKCEEGKTLVPGIILIANKGTHFTIASGNIINKDQKPIIEERIKQVNSMSLDQLKESQKSIVGESDLSTKTGGFGLLYIKRRACADLRCLFSEYDNDHLFYSFEVDIAAE